MAGNALHEGPLVKTQRETLQELIGRTETVDDTVTATPCAELAAHPLDQAPERPAPGFALPPLWHLAWPLKPLHRQAGDRGPTAMPGVADAPCRR